MRFTLSLILSAALASTAAAMPQAGPKEIRSEPQLIDLAPFKASGTGYKPKKILTEEEAIALTAKNLEEAKAPKTALERRNCKRSEDEYNKMRAKSTCKNPETRVEWRNFPHEYRLKWVKAARCMYDLPPRMGYPGSKNLAEDFAYIHQQLMENIHAVGHFNVWHRLFLWHYQETLRDQCGYPRDLPLPWWDETKDSGNFANSPIFGPDYYGSVPKVVVKDGKELATCIVDGAFANITVNIGPAKSVTTPHCLSRALNETKTALTGKAYCDLGNSYSDFWKMATTQEEGMHANGHEGIGSVMGDMWASPADPIFYMHHTFTDRYFTAWQNVDPARRTYAIGGPNATVGPVSTSTNDSPIRFLGLFPDTTIRQIQDAQGGFPFCYKYDY
ncbi:uncharacterized protein PpBr36_10084 [Pyricularia pennisetigena]|uniref:uncharacterized protein n=1 Tax=Pyricularia pennisetigena TaxID=1578925 RepID=UPI001152B576|nr:uncharacterized protein PpBr36_10084 [Pyricularia pennisetigena]TLS22383.1 hypothetical protein PpBr36_10084 [Pyricularia pennisetigena]